MKTNLNLFSSTTDYFLFIRWILTFGIIFLVLINITSGIILLTIYVIIAISMLYFLKKIFIIKVGIIPANNFSVKIHKQFFFSYKRATIYDFSNIKSYQYEGGIFRIRTKNGKNLKLIVDTEDKNLEKFFVEYKSFKEKIEQYNLTNLSDKISEDLPSHQTKYSKIYAVIILIILILTPIFYFYNNNNNTRVNVGFLLILYPPSLMYIYRVYSFNKNK